MNTARNLARVNSAVRRWFDATNLEPATGLVIRLESRRTAQVVHLEGRLTLEQAGTLQERLEEALREDAPRLIVNLTACPYVDSVSVAVLVSALQRARETGKELCLVGVGPQVWSVLQMLRLDTVFRTFTTVEVALAQ